MDNSILYSQIKRAVLAVEPDAKVIIYGSYARGEQHEESDVDIMIIVNKDIYSRQERQKISYSVYDVEIKNSIAMSPHVLTFNEWNEKINSTPFYENIASEGIEI